MRREDKPPHIFLKTPVKSLVTIRRREKKITDKSKILISLIKENKKMIVMKTKKIMEFFILF